MMRGKLTAEQLRQRLSTLAEDDSTSPERIGYREAAAVLSTFQLEQLRPLGFKPDAGVSAEFGADCELVRDEQGNECWALQRALRREVLGQLLKDKRLKEARVANSSQGPRQQILDAAMDAAMAGAPPQPMPDRLPVLRSMLVVSDWVEGVLPIQPVEKVRAEILRLQLLQPFYDLVGEHFAGRQAEYNTLSDYVGVFAAATTAEAFRRGVEWVASIRARPPLFVHGVGGIGKSSLIAKFILDHAQQANQGERFPYAYLDFDRTAINAYEPITLLLEAIRQITLQYPHVAQAGSELQQLWQQRMSKQDSVRQSGSGRGYFRLENRDYYLDSFAKFVESLNVAEDLPLLLVVDTFEEVQYRATTYVSEVFGLLEQVQKRIPRTRSVICGRDFPKVMLPDGEVKLQALPLGEFDQTAAIAFLENRDVKPRTTASQIVEQVGRSPLVLRVAAELWKKEGSSGKLEGLDTGFLAKLKGKRIETQLYTRILSHIHEDEVKKLAHPGLVLRKINPALILEVLAGPCEVAVSGMDQARFLLGKLRNEFTLVTADPSDPDTVIHRADVRSLMLDDLKHDQPDRVRKIHENAAAFYARQTTRSAWAEEMYHRLSLGVDRERFASTDWTGLDQLLPVSAIRELPAASQAYLAGRLPIELDGKAWESAAPEDWETYIARLVSEAQRTGAFADVSRRIEAAPKQIPPEMRARVRKLIPQATDIRTADPTSLARLREGLMEAFPTPPLLATWMNVSLNRQLPQLASPTTPFTQQVFQVVTTANQQGWLPQLVKAAVEEVPENQAVFDVAHRLNLTSLSPDALSAARISLESTKPLLLDANLMREHMGRAERQVCRVESEGHQIASGFLAGRCLLLMSAHPLGGKLRDEGILRGLRFRFDYIVRKDGVASTDSVSAVELVALDEELDYALVRVDQNAEHRGWLPVSSEMPGLGESLVSLQYPNGRGLTLAFEPSAVVGVEARRNILFRLNTAPGSSGSPCLNLKWRTVAMVLGSRTEGVNYGVLMSAVLESLSKAGVTLPAD